MNGLVYLLDTTSTTAAPGLLVFNPTTDQVTTSFPRLIGETVDGGLAALPGENLLVAASRDNEFLLFDPATGAIRERVAYTSTISNATVSGLAVLNGDIYLTAGGRITDVISREGAFIRSFINPVESGGLAGGTSGDGAYRVTLGPGEIIENLDFGNQSLLGTISGTKFEDIDGDGVRDSGEGPLAGVTVYLDLNNNGTLDAEESVEPDNFANGTDLTNAVPGVTLTVAGSNNAPNTFFKVRAGTDQFSSTGGKVFFEEGIPFWTSGFRFRADFEELVSKVSLDFISSSQFGQSGRLEVYNASGELLGSYTTAELSAGEIETMSVELGAAEIAYAVAHTNSGSFGRLDNLKFGADEPTAVTDETGDYVFTRLEDGEYIVREIVPEGFQQTSPDFSGLYYAYLYDSNGQMQPGIIDPQTGQVRRFGTPQGNFQQRMHGLVRTNSGEFFGLNGSDPDELFAVDLQTNALTRVGRITVNGVPTNAAFGLAYDAAADTIYSLVRDPADGRLKLAILDRNTGAATVLGPGTNQLTATSGLAFDSDRGVLVAFDNADDQFWQFDTSGNPTLLWDTAGLDGWGFAWNGDEFALHAVNFSGGDPALFNRLMWRVDPYARTIESDFFVASEQIPMESLDYYRVQGGHLVYVGRGDVVGGLDFANQRLNRPPVADAGGPYVIPEGHALTLDASASSDPDGDALTFAWDLDGDGQYDDAAGASPTLSWSELVALGLGDDGTFLVRVEVSDGQAADTATATLTVTNVAPVVTSIGNTASAIGGAAEGDTVSVAAGFTDAGTLDTHTATVDWGDGTSSSAVIAQGQGFGSLSGSHQYQFGGVYTITVTLADDDGGAAVATTTAYISGVGLHNGALQIVGTAADDSVIVNTAGGRLRVQSGFLPDRGHSRDLTATAVEVIQVFLGAGNDHFVLAGSIATPLVVDAGTGNDHVRAGAGRSILIGGLGSDHLIGGSDQDILIAGTTAFDGEAEALRALLKEWASSRTLEQRVANLYDGSGTSDRENGDNFLTVGTGGTVEDDSDEDILTGGPDTDWFFYDPLLDDATVLRNELFANELESLLA